MDDILCFETFIEEIYDSYNSDLNFKIFLLEIDDTQSKPKKFFNKFKMIKTYQEILFKDFNDERYKKYKNLIKKYYFNLVNPENWYITAFSFSRMSYKYSCSDNCHFTINDKWEKLVNKALKSKIKIVPYIDDLIEKPKIYEFKILTI